MKRSAATMQIESSSAINLRQTLNDDVETEETFLKIAKGEKFVDGMWYFACSISERHLLPVGHPLMITNHEANGSEFPVHTSESSNPPVNSYSDSDDFQGITVETVEN